MAKGAKTKSDGSLESMVYKDKEVAPQFAVGLPIFLELAQKQKRMRAQATLVGWVRPRILITTAPSDSRMMVVRSGTELIVRYLLEGRVYGFVTHLLNKQHDPLPLWMLEYPELVEVKNLRRSPRVPITLKVKTHLDETWYTIDLSEHGTCLAVDSPQNVGELVLLSFTLPDGGKIENLGATVMRTNFTKDEMQIGVQFEETDQGQLQKIVKYLNGILSIAKTK